MAIARSQFVTATAASVSSLSAVFSSAISSANSLVVVSGVFHTVGQAGVFSTLVDNVNAGGFTSRIFSTMTSDTAAHLLIHDKLNISSGAGASTYRVELKYTAANSPAGSFCAIEYSGGPFTFGSSVSLNGTSSGAAAGQLTASSSPALFVSGGIVNSTATFASTGTGGNANYVTTVDPTNTDQIVNVVDATAPSSLAENIGHSLGASTRWLAGSVVYLGFGSGAAAAIGWPWSFGLSGVQ